MAEADFSKQENIQLVLSRYQELPGLIEKAYEAWVHLSTQLEHLEQK
jgi:hypothetical protein